MVRVVSSRIPVSTGPYFEVLYGFVASRRGGGFAFGRKDPGGGREKASRNRSSRDNDPTPEVGALDQSTGKLSWTNSSGSASEVGSSEVDSMTSNVPSETMGNLSEWF